MRAEAVNMRSLALPRALALAAATLALACAAPAKAQVFFEPFAYRFQIPLDRDSEPPPMRPREVTDAARMQGFEPVGRIARNRDVFVFDAQDRDGRPVRVVMDAYEGDILRVMRRLEPMRRVEPTRRLEPMRQAAPASRDAPHVIEGVGPDDEAPAARANGGRVERPAAKRAKRDATREAARTPSRSAPTPPSRPAPSVAAPGEAAPKIERRPLPAPEPAQTRLQDRPARQEPAPAATPAAPAPTPVGPDVAAERPGPIPPPPFMQSEAARPAPARNVAPPVAPLDEVVPKIRPTPPVPPAPLE